MMVLEVKSGDHQKYFYSQDHARFNHLFQQDMHFLSEAWLVWCSGTILASWSWAHNPLQGFRYTMIEENEHVWYNIQIHNRMLIQEEAGDAAVSRQYRREEGSEREWMSTP